MNRIKGFIVDALEAACTLVDKLPFGIACRLHIGCPSGLAALSYRLDQKWGTCRWDLNPVVFDDDEDTEPMSDEEWLPYAEFLGIDDTVPGDKP